MKRAQEQGEGVKFDVNEQVQRAEEAQELWLETIQDLRQR